MKMWTILGPKCLSADANGYVTATTDGHDCGDDGDDECSLATADSHAQLIK